jgi:DNA-binding MarR family transcriptional regulator
VTHSPESFTPKPGSLLQRGNYAIFRILSIINAAGPKGITTVTLHQRLGTHTNRTNAIIRKAHELGYIDRIKGESSGRGQFAPILNVITEKGRQLLASTTQ